MAPDDDFDLTGFTPYLLNMAAEATSLDFQPAYRDDYGMLRTEWRVLFHLGRYGAMTAKEICTRARIHKTKVSRAVAALEAKRFLARTRQQDDRRSETLSLTRAGEAAYRHLAGSARDHDARLMAQFTAEEQAVLHRCLRRLATL